MTDPITLAVLGSVAATEGVKFLYGQAAELIKAFREKRKQAKAAEQVAPDLDVHLRPSPVLDAAPAPTPADTQVVAGHEAEVVQLLSRLSPYAQDLADVDVDDPQLAEGMGRLRQILEAAYGQRLTFKGEKRESTGTRVAVKQVLGEAEGTVMGIGSVSGPVDAEVDQKADHLAGGGSMTGIGEVKGGKVSDGS